jgi:hypothetical protein
MREIDPNDPIYKGLTKPELMRLKHFSPQEKETLSIALFGESLFGRPPWQKQRDQRWAALLGEVAPVGKPYRITHEDIKNRLASLARHRARTPSANESSTQANTVSAFSDWVIRLYVPERSNAALMSGLEGERAVVAHRLRVQRAKLEVPRWEQQGWKLVHDGVRGAFEGGFSIPSLEVGGASMTGVPDLVFRERKTGRILIVELKVSEAILPSDGWPNLRAQLWAYSRIEKWSTAPEVLLAGEVWSPESAGLQRRRTYQWRARDEDLQSESKELFEAYGGRVLQ